MMTTKQFTVSLIIIGLILNIFSYYAHAPENKNISEKDFVLVDYKEKAGFKEDHVLSIGFDKNKFSIDKSEINYKIVGNKTDIDVFKRCVDINFVVVDGIINFTGKVKQWGVYNVDIQPVVKGLTVSKYAWWNSSYKSYRMVNVTASQVYSDLNNFPVPVVVGYDSFYNSGASIRFVELDNVTVLSHQLDGVWNASGNNVYWVKLPNLNSSSQFLMYYNNSLATATDTTDVWDANYLAVYHMNSSSDKTVKDYTSNANHGENKGSYAWTTGKVNDGQFFDGNDDYISMPSNCYVNFACTVTMWGTMQDFNKEGNSFFDSRDADTSDYYVLCEFGLATDKFEFYSSGSFDILGGTPADNTWFNWVGALNTNDAVSYINSVIVGKDTSCSIPGSTYSKVYIGNAGTLIRDFQGTIDEFRLSNTRRTNAWIITEYNSINNYSTFCSLSSAYELPIANTNPNVTSFNLVNGSGDNNICVNLSVYIYDDEGDTIYYEIDLNNFYHLVSNSNNITLYINMSDCLLLGHNYIVYVNVSNDNVIWNRFYYVFRTEECCNNGVSIGDNMEITIGISTLGIFLTLIIFALAYYSDKEKLFKPLLFFFDVPLCLAVGISYLYIGSSNSLTWWIGIIWICFSGICSFAGLYYSMNYGKK